MKPKSKPSTASKPPAADRPLARKGKLSPQLCDEFAALIRAGNHIETAAAICRVKEEQVSSWLEKGARGRSGLCREFYAAVRKARAEAEAEELANIRGSALGHTVVTVRERIDAKTGKVLSRTKQIKREKDWKAGAWALERRYPDRWGKYEKPAEKNGSPADAVKLDLERLNKHERITLAALLRKAEGR